MFIDTRPRHRNALRPPEKDAPGFKQWVRGRQCLFAGKGGCGGKIIAMHLDWAGGKGTSTKVADRFVVPCCWKHHEEQHNDGWITFLHAMGLTKEDLLGAAGFLWQKWPGRAAWERKQER